MGRQLGLRLVTATGLAAALLLVVGMPALPTDPSAPLSFAGPQLLQITLVAAAWIAVMALVASVAFELVPRWRGRRSRLARINPRVGRWLVLGVGLAVLVAGAAHGLSGFRVCCADPGSVREALLHAR